MGIRKKWSRLIKVDGVDYRYHIAPERHDGLSLSICVQRVEPAGQRLLSGFMKPMKMWEVGPQHWWGEPIADAVTPSVIRRLILAALDRGWKPTEVGLAAFGLAGWKVVPELPKPDEKSS